MQNVHHSYPLAQISDTPNVRAVHTKHIQAFTSFAAKGKVPFAANEVTLKVEPEVAYVTVVCDCISLYRHCLTADRKVQ
jgi:hypothetical protein